MSTSCLLIMLVIAQLNLSFAETVNCPKSNDCSCTESGHCYLNCIGADYCKGDRIIIQCQSNQPCTITCNGISSCSDSTLNGSSATDVEIICQKKDSCKGSGTIYCGTGDCILRCDLDSTACSSVTIDTNGAKSFQCYGIGCNNNNVPNQYTASPTYSPSKDPTSFPTVTPTISPSNNPSSPPTNVPTISPIPTAIPTLSPSANPSSSPTDIPSVSPTLAPTYHPTAAPTKQPTLSPSSNPSSSPTDIPSISPIPTPTKQPTLFPSSNPSSFPSISPSIEPTSDPTKAPTNNPSIHPTMNPTLHPSSKPTLNPSYLPSTVPTNIPSISPVSSPTIPPILTATNNPSQLPSHAPTYNPTTNSPTTLRITSIPTTSEPTTSLSSIHTINPTTLPSNAPTIDPTATAISSTNTSIIINRTLTTSSTSTTFFSNGPTTDPTSTTASLNDPSTTLKTTTSKTITSTISTSETISSPSSKMMTSPVSIASTPEYWICDKNCYPSMEDRILTVEVTFAFSPNIEYNLRNAKCFIYKVYEKSLSNNEYFLVFDVCHVQILEALGGKQLKPKQASDHCEFPPCFVRSIASTLPRRLLQTKDASIEMTMIAEDSVTFRILNTLHIQSIENDFEAVFREEFGLEVVISITVVERETIATEEENNNEGGNSVDVSTVFYIIGSLLFILCCIGLLVWYLKEFRKHHTFEVIH